MSDGPTHFKKETLRLVAKGLRVPQHFTLQYTPWSNGAVERLGKALPGVFRTVSSELRIWPAEWPYVLALIQSAINNSQSPQRAGIPPVQALTGMDPFPLITTFYRSFAIVPGTFSDVMRERTLSKEKL